MSKYVNDSNSRGRTRNYNRYFNQRPRSNSTSPDNVRHSNSKSSTFSSRYMKSKHRSNSPSEYSSSRHKHINRSSRHDRISKKKSRRSSSSVDSNYSNASYNEPKNYVTSNSKEKNGQNSKCNAQSEISVMNFETVKDNDNNWDKKNVYDVMKRDNEIEQIRQEGFVFKVFKPSIEKRQNEINDVFDVPKLNEEIINSLAVEESAFLISSQEQLLSGWFKLLTKQERCVYWAKRLFASFQKSD